MYDVPHLEEAMELNLEVVEEVIKEEFDTGRRTDTGWVQAGLACTLPGSAGLSGCGLVVLYMLERAWFDC